MKVTPLFSDSLGVRSLSAHIHTNDVSIIIDPSAALGPKRYGLPPHPLELEALHNAKDIIRNLAQESKIHIISHYHYDHYDPHEDFYSGKTLLVKDPKHNINNSQQKRGTDFYNTLQDSCTFIPADNTVHRFDDTTISFSEPMPHGPDGTRLGTVIMSTISDNEQVILHASDVQGPISTKPTDHIIKTDPDLLILDGVPTIFLGWKLSKENLTCALCNLQKILDETSAHIIYDHHHTRDKKYLFYHKDILSAYPNRIQTYAEYLNKENRFLESLRKDLYAQASDQ